MLLQIMAQRFGIPELAYPGNLAAINKHIGSSAAGIKLAFSFAWNEKGREHDPAHVVSTPVLAPEAHLFRQDVDAYYVALAASLGATIRQQTRIQDIRIEQDHVSIKLGEKDPLKVRFVVDAAGFRSPIADHMKLRDNARPMQSNTRSLFTHMVGVKLYEEVIASPDIHGSPTMLSQSTLHHIFDGGWLWIIPFDNHPFSTNKLCSVGLQFDIDKYGPPGDPEMEFKQFLEDYPSVAKHFVGAARVREWTVAPRLNYTSRETVGDRYCLLAHAAGFVDPLFSRGLANTFESINRLEPKLLRAAAQDRWQREDLISFEQYSLEVVRINDRLVANSYDAFSSFPLWNAWFRIWLSGSYIGVLRFRKILADFMASGDAIALEKNFENARFPGHLSIESARYEAMFEAACQAVESHKKGALTEKETISILHKLFMENRTHLPLDFSDFSNHFVSRATQEFGNSLLDWANNAPDGMDAVLARGPVYPTFNFLDDYRYGDRLTLAAQADNALAAGRANPAL